MSEIKDGGPAFPHQHDLVLYNDAEKREPAQTIRGVWDGGMSLRDYFAAKALIALTSIPVWVQQLDDECKTEGIQFKEGLATHCYWMADAMLKAREAK